MRRVLLVVEDYNELLFLETLLKKVGFVVESIRNELSLSEKMMGFSPELVIATGDGNKISGMRVSKRVKKKGAHTKLLLLFPRNTLQKEHSLDSFVADGAVETPLNPRSILTSVCQLVGVKVEQVMSKFEKLPLAQEQEVPEGIQIISSKKKGAKANTEPEADEPDGEGGESDGSTWAKGDYSRRKRYMKILVDSPKSPEVVFSRQQVQKEMDMARKTPDPPGEDEREEQRLAFVKALFKKK